MSPDTRLPTSSNLVFTAFGQVKVFPVPGVALIQLPGIYPIKIRLSVAAIDLRHRSILLPMDHGYFNVARLVTRNDGSPMLMFAGRCSNPVNWLEQSDIERAIQILRLAGAQQLVRKIERQQRERGQAAMVVVGSAQE